MCDLPRFLSGVVCSFCSASVLVAVDGWGVVFSSSLAFDMVDTRSSACSGSDINVLRWFSRNSVSMATRMFCPGQNVGFVVCDILSLRPEPQYRSLVVNTISFPRDCSRAVAAASQRLSFLVRISNIFFSLFCSQLDWSLISILFPMAFATPACLASGILVAVSAHPSSVALAHCNACSALANVSPSWGIEHWYEFGSGCS